MENLTSAELLNIIIALDNEAANNNGQEAQNFRNLKWKVFALYAEVLKVEESLHQPPRCPYCGDDTCAGHCA